MNPKNTFSEGRRFLLFYLCGSIVYGAALVLLYKQHQINYLNDMLLLLVPPIFYAVYYYRRRIYLTAVVILYMVCAVSLNSMASNFRASVHTLVLITMLIVGSAELVYYAKRRQQMATSALRESEERLRRILESVRDYALFTLDTEGRIDGWNVGAQGSFGYEEWEILGQPQSVLYGPAQDAPLPEMQTACERGQSVYEGWYMRKNGSHFFGHGVLTPMFDEQKRLRGYVNVVQDISEKKRAEQALQQWSQTLEERVKERTRSILFYQERLQTIVTQLSISEETERRHIATELHDYLAQLLVVGRMKVDQLPRENDASRAAEIQAEVRAILDQALKYTRTLIAELSPKILYDSGFSAAVRWLAEQMKQLHLQVEVQEEGPPITLSEDKAYLLFTVVRELLMNVVKHAGSDAARVGLQNNRNEELVIAVEDRGKGFDASQLNYSDPTQGRFGLLSVCERIEGLGGRCDVDSALGRGTKVILTVSLRKDPSNPIGSQGAE